jgi:hypothetical protein
MFEKYHADQQMRTGFRRLEFNPLQPAVDKYFKAAPQERAAIVDATIDRMERMRGMMERLRGLGSRPGGDGSSAAGTAGGPDGQSGPDPRSMIRQQIEQHIQQGNPQQSAQMMEFMKHVRQRRSERGLPEF